MIDDAVHNENSSHCDLAHSTKCEQFQHYFHQRHKAFGVATKRSGREHECGNVSRMNGHVKRTGKSSQPCDGMGKCVSSDQQRGKREKEGGSP